MNSLNLSVELNKNFFNIIVLFYMKNVLEITEKHKSKNIISKREENNNSSK